MIGDIWLTPWAVQDTGRPPGPGARSIASLLALQDAAHELVDDLPGEIDPNREADADVAGLPIDTGVGHCDTTT
jgi:hypothetical protein